MEWLILSGGLFGVLIGLIVGLSVGLLIGYLLWHKHGSQEPLPINEVTFMYVVKDNQPSVPYSVQVGEVKDAEGHVIDGAAFTIEVDSDNIDAVEVVEGENGTGTLNFGAPGLANITATVKSGDTVLAAGSASFTVTAGDPASVASVALKFEGLTEV